MHATQIVSRRVSLALVCMALSGPVHAIGEMADAASGGQETVPLISGGIGDDDLSYLKSVERQYNLKVMFTESNGVFLSDLPVTILDKKGDTVVSTVTKGPLLLVDLPPGSYTVSASEGDVSRKEKVSVSGHSLRTLQFRFPGSDPRSTDK